MKRVCDVMSLSDEMQNVVYDIDLDQKPTLPRSRIYCGKNAFFIKKGKILIKYEDVAWTYKIVHRNGAFITYEECVIFTKDGKSYKLIVNDDEFRWLLENYVILSNPNIVVGYGPEQERMVDERYPIIKEKTESSKKMKFRIVGIVLLAVSLVSLVGMVLRLSNGEPFSDASTNLAPIALFGIPGIILTILGRKKDK